MMIKKKNNFHLRVTSLELVVFMSSELDPSLANLVNSISISGDGRRFKHYRCERRTSQQGAILKHYISKRGI
jgi:hypothetical protein